MKMIKTISCVIVLLFIWTALLCIGVGSEDIKVYDYSITTVYKYQGKIDSVVILKNHDFVGVEDVLLVAVREGNKTIRATVVEIDENMAVGENEIPIFDMDIEENQTAFVTVLDSIDSIKPLTDGTIAEIINEENRVVGDIEDWTVSDNGKRILSYVGDDTEIVIPNYLSGKHITYVGADTNAEEKASIFYDKAESITSLTISEGIEVIGYTAFLGCKNISNDLYIPNSVKQIGIGAFYNCIKMTGDIVIPEKVKYIPNLVFAGCFKLNSVDLGENITSIGTYAFYYCEGLNQTLEIPPTVSKIGSFAFTGCENLSGKLDLGECLYIGDGAFAGCSKLSGTLELPDGLTYIGYGAFEQCSRLSGELVFPSNLEHIGDAAFNHCTGFTNESLIIPKSVKTLGGDLEVLENTYYSSHLFYNFGKDSTFKAFGVEVGNEYFCSVDGVLYNADKTRLIAYPRGKTDAKYEILEGVTQIDELAFSRCPYLKELVLPDSFVILSEVPANVINQDGNTLAVALYNYTGVEKISVRETNLNYISQNGILYSKDMKTLWYCPTDYVGQIEIPSGVERIEKGAFYGVTTAISYTGLTIPSSVNYIEPYALSKINSLLAGKIEISRENPNYYIAEDGKIKAVE